MVHWDELLSSGVAMNIKGSLDLSEVKLELISAMSAANETSKAMVTHTEHTLTCSGH